MNLSLEHETALELDKQTNKVSSAVMLEKSYCEKYGGSKTSNNKSGGLLLFDLLNLLLSNISPDKNSPVKVGSNWVCHCRSQT